MFTSTFGIASARITATSDIHEQVTENKSLVKVEGDECFKLESDISNGEVFASTDVGIPLVLGCGEALSCLEDKSSSTGARCVDLKETIMEENTCGYLYDACKTDSDCCAGYGLKCNLLYGYSYHCERT